MKSNIVGKATSPKSSSYAIIYQWMAFALAVSVGFVILTICGGDINKNSPPLPERIVLGPECTEVLMTKETVLDGQQSWQSLGGMSIGSIWGHGSYQAPDFSADFLHREADFTLNKLITKTHGAGRNESSLSAVQLAPLRQQVIEIYRTNTYDVVKDVLCLSKERYESYVHVSDYYHRLFGDDASEEMVFKRKAYALTKSGYRGAVPLEKRKLLTQFFWWTAWAASTERPHEGVEHNYHHATYTNNWPFEPLVDNQPTASMVYWSMISVILLLIGIALIAWWKMHEQDVTANDAPIEPPTSDPLDALPITPSQSFLRYYVLVALLLMVAQVSFGALTANNSHTPVEAKVFFGYTMSEIFPFAFTRSCHLQLAVFWIALAFLTAGLFLAVTVGGGKEPFLQREGIIVLLGALLVLVPSALIGLWLGVQQRFASNDVNWWFGTTGLEYMDMGRFFQILLMVGLVLWLVLVVNGMFPTLLAVLTGKPTDVPKSLLVLFSISAICIALFYGVVFNIHSRTAMSVMEKWRWWLVHLWVEGFFEVFASSFMAFLFSILRLVKTENATRDALYSAAIFLIAGIPGTCHHLYFCGTTTAVLAVGACFSALEVAPLTLMGFEAASMMKHVDKVSWMARYRWAFLYLAAVPFWNLVGAGVFGFLINPPIALYYFQGLQSTTVHGHTALFGVYGNLAIALLLLVWSRVNSVEPDARMMTSAFWLLQLNLMGMVLFSLLPMSIAQIWAATKYGLWYARGEQFMMDPWTRSIQYARIVPDILFALGALLLVGAVFKSFIAASNKKDNSVAPARAKNE